MPRHADAQPLLSSVRSWSRLSLRYNHDRIVRWPQFIEPDQVDALLRSTAQVATRRVTCGIPNVSWDEQQFDVGHDAHEFFRRPSLLELVRILTGLPKVDQLTTWTSRYRLGEYINPHRDRSGTVQLLVCLQAPPGRNQGGQLRIGSRGCWLRPGAAVAFEATTLEHFTTPLRATPTLPEPTRVVLVGRYHLSAAGCG